MTHRHYSRIVNVNVIRDYVANLSALLIYRFCYLETVLLKNRDVECEISQVINYDFVSNQGEPTADSQGLRVQRALSKREQAALSRVQINFDQPGNEALGPDVNEVSYRP